ncbi:MAG: hypothetical protein ETSY1_45320 [Candidatus Entotheonella factor]|uniref:TIR domain-containing protein n=1 Tax=Entotheonella factor TaxID=1429438 RepID=W4L212_ENTF1|nr:MAG: hypothetical protein ETSY1_45320 [Candidatus Entotheonella factor]
MAEASQDQCQRPDFFISYTGVDRAWDEQLQGEGPRA